MRDGTLTRREERHLAEVAMALGISPVQAVDLRDEVEGGDCIALAAARFPYRWGVRKEEVTDENKGSNPRLCS